MLCSRFFLHLPLKERQVFSVDYIFLTEVSVKYLRYKTRCYSLSVILEPNVLQDPDTRSRPGSTSCPQRNQHVCFQAAGDRDPNLVLLLHVTRIGFYF